MNGSYLGPTFSTAETQLALDAAGAVYHELDVNEIVERTASQLADGKVVGWFQGRMEFGPRALGNRSILGDARSPEMQRQMNLKIKYRESFRPFAPAVVRERVADYFEMTESSPYMLLVAPVSEKVRIAAEAGDRAVGLDKLQVPRSTIPAVTHVDLSARVQTVERDDNERFYDLIARFGEITGTPVLINTSFNVRGEPIVCTPDDAFRCFMRTEMDVLVVGDMMMFKADQTVESGGGDINEIFPMD